MTVLLNLFINFELYELSQKETEEILELRLKLDFFVWGGGRNFNAVSSNNQKRFCNSASVLNKLYASGFSALTHIKTK